MVRILLAVQAMVESLLREYPNVLTLRVRMPIIEDLLYPRNFITKIIKYDKVSQTYNCMLPPLSRPWRHVMAFQLHTL